MKINNTIEDVASKAGVSKATVSRVFNNSTSVSPDTRKRVVDAMRKLKYTPNLNARRLAGSHGAIALVLQESVKDFFENPFWRDVVDGFVSKAANQQQHPVLIFHSKEEGRRKLIKTLIMGQYEAVAFFGWQEDITGLERDIPKGMRVVFGGRPGNCARFTYVGANNFIGAHLATSHLIEVGCKRIATITGNLNIESGRERLSGYEKALIESGIKVSKELIMESDYSSDTARKVLQTFLKRKIAFDGIFAANDLMAIEAISILQDFKIRVPEHVKLIGFDDIPQSVLVNPPLSTIHQPSYLLGQTVAEQLLKPNHESLENIELPVSLVKRKSTD